MKKKKFFAFPLSISEKNVIFATLLRAERTCLVAEKFVDYGGLFGVQHAEYLWEDE